MKQHKRHRQMINGKPVVNATRRITLKIRPLDTKAGAVKDPGACAAARAAMRDIPNCVAARVHLGRAYILQRDNTGEKWLRYKTTDALRSEIIAFDRGGKFEPGEYDLRPMSPSDMKPKRPGPSSTNKTSKRGSDPTKSPRKLHVVKGVRRRGANR